MLTAGAPDLTQRITRSRFRAELLDGAWMIAGYVQRPAHAMYIPRYFKSALTCPGSGLVPLA